MARIAILDDEVLVREMLEQLMTRMGHEVVQAADGAEGLRLMREWPVDVLITDIVMPGTDGLEVIEEVARRSPGTRIIAMTGFHPSRLSLAQVLGADRTVQKPFPLMEMRDAVAELLTMPLEGRPGTEQEVGGESARREQA